ncbi:HAD-IC family P-type ATPase [Alteraurantiacibacter aestuarii]|uniref:cation-translocating P-type ATPase n=1 Tax=Alteraurantiacibacter aestuarii TaxID=650004 RepID=UPI0031D81C09
MMQSESSTDTDVPASAVMGGLTSREAELRLKADGPNLIPQRDRRTALRIIGEVLREPMLALLLSGGAIYMVLGDLAEALILLAFATFSVAVTAIQETRTEHVLEALRDLSAPRALVIRDGRQQRIPGASVVNGDLLVLDAGDRVAADAQLLEAEDLYVDESLLTGESMPVRKCAQAQQAGPPLTRRPGGEDQPFVYSGSMISRGRGMAQVVAIGSDSEMGRIGKSLAALDTEAPRLRRETARIVRISALGGATIAVIVVLLYGFTRGSWIDAVLAGITTAMTLLPEEFPVVLTVFMAMGAWRIGQAGVLTRRAAAIETLGSTTVLCTDKTGTLTENRMAVVRLWQPSAGEISVGSGETVTGPFAQILNGAALASPAVAVDPMDVAIHQAAGESGLMAGAGMALTNGHGFRPELRVMANEWQELGASRLSTIAVKGAPESIARLCRLEGAKLAKLTQAADAMARQGIRVLGVALSSLADPRPGVPLDEYGYNFAGLLGLADPLRQSVPAAIAQCRSAGIRVVMITGDYAVTASAIAAAAGIADGDVLTGEALDALSDESLAERLATVSVFARILPEQKLRIVEAFKARGEVVAMTGDGVNDAPSLKAAHIGIAMGKRGTDVAREAASIVLLEDDFDSIVRTVALGRRIYDNIRKAMAFIFAVHVPIAGLTLMPLLMGQPLLFGPIHIALLEMVIDPVCALVFEAESPEADTMSRKPRDPRKSILSLPVIAWSVLQGVLAFAALAVVYLAAVYWQLPEGQWRGLMFFALIAVILALILVNRSFSASLVKAFYRKNRALVFILAIVTTVSALILTVDPVRKFLKFDMLELPQGAAIVGTGIGVLLLLEWLKALAARHLFSGGHHDLAFRKRRQPHS